MKRLQILGPGCPKCETLARNVESAARAAGVECTIEKVTDIAKIAAFGVMFTPVLVIDGKVVSSGKVLDVETIRAMLDKS